MLTMFTNVHFSRRKDFIVIQDETAATLWTGRKFIAAFRYMLDNEHYTFLLSEEDDSIRVMIGKV